MSGYPAGSGEGNGLENLFAQLRQSQSQSQQPKPVSLEPSYSYYNHNNSGYFGQASTPQQPHGYHHPSVSSPIPTPPVAGLQPHHSSAIMSPVENVQARPPPAGSSSNADRTSSLLNLLKFSQPSANSPTQSTPTGPPAPLSREASTGFAGSEVLGHLSSSSHDRVTSDLLATLRGSIQAKPTQPSPQLPTLSQPASSAFRAAGSPPSVEAQSYLLQLLNQPKPSQVSSPPQLKQTKILTPPSKASSQHDDIIEATQALNDSTFDLNMMGSSATESLPAFGKENAREFAPKAAQGIFTYVNPFEQLAASSPRIRTPKNATPGPASSASPKIQILKRQEGTPDNKRKIDERSTISSPAHSKRKLEPASQASSSPPTPLPDGRTQVEALIGIGAPSGKESVHAALNEVGGQADKQVQEAIAQVEREEAQTSIEDDLRDLLAAKTEKEFEASAQIAAKAIKKELEQAENAGALDSLPTPVAEAVKDIIDETAQGHIADSWESAETEDGPAKEEDDEDEDSFVKVYNFPMKPWSSISIKETGEPRPVFREDSVIDIARLKKEFDQIDRTLVTGTNNFIIYGMSKHGGVRIIRQDDGKDAKLFTETHDRIFSVVASASLAEQKESIIGTGISGTVYWALIKDGEGDHIEERNPEMYGFALPPIQSHETETPGGVLKTRARKSSGHPDFFAVGRGKFINIIWPSVIMKQSYLKHGKDRIVDTEKYLSKHSLKVNTGKAGKDFTFSEDDTTIVSLDKAGRVKFWDVRSLTSADISLNPSDAQHIEVKDPLVTFITTPPNEKSWPTSVLFVDKLRPYQRGGALRYLIVGMKQNHTLQLWDLALGKPVQEIHLPHGKESDAVCSVVYHAATGMIIIGHPTRNSIYFLHLSAPKYNLQRNVTQAEYMQKLLSNDSSIPKPESTAVISGMREYSFANKGMLRSLDILQTPNSAAASPDTPTLFELYVMHSKGVTCVNIKQSSLGWGPDNKVLHPVVAEKSGVISIDTLKDITATPTPEVNDTPVQTTLPTRPAPRPAAKESVKEIAKKPSHSESSSSAAKVDDKKDASISNGVTSASGPEKQEKRKRRKGTANESTPGNSSHSGQSKPLIMDPTSNSRNGSLSKSIPASIPEATATPSRELTDASLKNIETRVAGEVKKLFSESIESLYQNIKEDRRTQAAVSDAKQDAMLRLVSATLSDNIEATLGRIVNEAIEKTVLPAISETSSQAVNQQLGQSLSAHVGQSIPKELQRYLPDAVGKALQQPQLLKLMSDALAKSVAFRVEETFASLLQNVVTPQFTTLAIQTSQRIATDIHRQATEQISSIERQRTADSIKIEQLTQLVTGLTETVSSMAASQSEFQGQFLRLQQQATSDRRQPTRHEGSTPRASISRHSQSLTGPIVEKTQEELEYETMLNSITKAMSEGQYENAVIQWLQTRREQEFFANYFSKFSPDFVRDLSPLLLLSLGATISMEIQDELLKQRVAWMEAIVSTFQGHVSTGTMDDQVRDLIPKIMGIYVQRLEHLFMRISQVAAQEPILKRISQLVNAANRILETSRGDVSFEQGIYNS